MEQQENLKIQNHNLILFIESLEKTSILCSLGIKNQSILCSLCTKKSSVLCSLTTESLCNSFMISIFAVRIKHICIYGQN